MGNETFERRLMSRIGRPAATLFVESGTDRHFLLEISFAAVAAYLGGKFLDGFVDGLGITDLGKDLGAKVKDSVVNLVKLFSGDLPEPEQEPTLDRQVATLHDVARRLGPYAGNTAARLKAENFVTDLMRDKGLPPSEARRIAAAVADEMLSIAQAPAANG